MAEKLKLAFILPTKGRYQELENLLDSLGKQTLRADFLVIVDANKDYAENKLKNHALPIKYIHTGPNALTEARNIGIKNVPPDIDLIGFLDDDVILYNDAIENMLNFWQEAPKDTGGVAFNIINNRRPRNLWFLKKIFLRGDRSPGNVLPSGYQTFLDKVKENTYAKWLPGGATVWRREVFDKFKFDENLKGYGLNEDMDFSYSVGKEYRLLVLEKAKLVHRHSPVRNNKENIFFGISEITNKFYFINKHREFSRIMFYWASFGMLLENAALGIFTFNSGYLKRALGNILGLKNTLLLKKNLV